MKKALILAESMNKYMFIMKHFNLKQSDYKYVVNWNDMCGWWVDMPVIMIEGYVYNKNYTLEMMANAGYRFDNIAFLSEGEIWNNDNKEDVR